MNEEKIENRKAEVSKEQQVVFLKDFPQYERVMHEYRCGDVFWCPKCESSIICLCEEYEKNNIMNSMGKEITCDDFKKIVLQCGNCQYKDILIKFLKSIKQKTYIWDEASPYHKPLIKPKKPYYYSPNSIHKRYMQSSI